MSHPYTVKSIPIPPLPLDESADHAVRLAEMARLWPDRQHAEAAVTAKTICERLHQVVELLANLEEAA
jgi:hypothetical protein